jgi:hypothetical protein
MTAVAIKQREEVACPHETAPLWMKGTEEAGDGFPLDFELSSLDLENAVTSIREQVTRFPHRGRM